VRDYAEDTLGSAAESTSPPDPLSAVRRGGTAAGAPDEMGSGIEGRIEQTNATPLDEGLGVRRALTLDRHFATAGFETVPAARV
jgi:hypothetical protein